MKMSQSSVGPNENISNSLNDDSFDDEFRLLESTLTDFKEDDTKTDDCTNKIGLNDSGVRSLDALDAVEITPEESSKSLNNNALNVLLRCDEPQEVQNSIPIGLNSINFENSKISDVIENTNSFSLSTPQHFKPTGKCNEPLTNRSLVSSSVGLEFRCVALSSLPISNSDVEIGKVQSSTKPLCSVQENINNKHDKINVCKFSDVNAASCYSSFVESQERTYQASTDNFLQSNAEVSLGLNVCKKVEPHKLDGLDLNCKELETCEESMQGSNEDFGNISKADFDLKSYSVSVFKTTPTLKTELKNLQQCQRYNITEPGKKKILGDVILDNSFGFIDGIKQNDKVIQSNNTEEATRLCPIVKIDSDGLIRSTDGNLELKESSEILKLYSKMEEDIILTSRTNEGFFDDKGQIQNRKTVGGPSSDSKNEISTFLCSTPIVSKLLKDNVEHSVEFSSGNMSPLNANYMKKKILKRANLCLERIDEVDESRPTDCCPDKRLKLDNPTSSFENNIIALKNDANVSTSMPCFEAPAKSILKKWHPSCLSRDSFLVLDECGDTDLEETIKPSKESVDHSSGALDDFEIACKSLAEELLMSSSNYETLEKYNSQVQLDSRMDDQKFDEVLQELTLNYEMDEKSFLSKMKPIEESKFTTGENITNLSCITMDESLNNTENKKYPLASVCDSAPSEDKTNLVSVKGLIAASVAENCLSINREDSPETSSSSQYTRLNCDKERVVTTKVTDEKLPMDEEDVLLEEDIKVEQKQYVYFEYVSLDPKENEDNYNPEWQKLGKLTSDEERYKAVRDRWRSLVPPDPNRDLTCRQWRKKNNKPPLNIPSLNNNQQMFDGNEKNQLCTAVFERKIANILQGLQIRRRQIIKERNVHFEELAVVQDEQQRRFILRGTNAFEMGMLQKRHIQIVNKMIRSASEIQSKTSNFLGYRAYYYIKQTPISFTDMRECVMLKNRFDSRLDQINKNTEEKVLALKKACDEVLSFQKFYKGVGATDEEVCMYMTDIQVEELMETEEMLEQYSKYYK